MFNKIKNGLFNSLKKSSRADSIFSNTENIESYDDELWSSFKNESQRQEDHVELIASENYASSRILEAQGSVLTNKYAEGYPSKRYYGGCEYVDSNFLSAPRRLLLAATPPATTIFVVSLDLLIF